MIPRTSPVIIFWGPNHPFPVLHPLNYPFLTDELPLFNPSQKKFTRQGASHLSAHRKLAVLKLLPAPKSPITWHLVLSRKSHTQNHILPKTEQGNLRCPTLSPQAFCELGKRADLLFNAESDEMKRLLHPITGWRLPPSTSTCEWYVRRYQFHSLP